MQPRVLPEHVRWVESSVEGILYELESLRAQLRALAALPPALRGADRGLERALTEKLHAQMALLAQECALLRDELVRLRESGHPGAGPAGRFDPDSRPA